VEIHVMGHHPRSIESDFFPPDLASIEHSMDLYCKTVKRSVAALICFNSERSKSRVSYCHKQLLHAHGGEK